MIKMAILTNFKKNVEKELERRALIKEEKTMVATEKKLEFGLKEVTKDIEWKNIDHEIYRVYKFPEGKVKITRPVLLNVSKSGGHRILDAENVSHYIPFKWIEIRFETDDNVAWKF